MTYKHSLDIFILILYEKGVCIITCMCTEYTHSLINKLKSMPLFEGTKDDTVEDLLQKGILVLHSLKENQIIKVKKERSLTDQKIYLLVEGMTSYVKYDYDGRCSMLDYKMPGNIIYCSSPNLNLTDLYGDIVASTESLIAVFYIFANEVDSEFKIIHQNLIKLLVEENTKQLRRVNILSCHTLRDKIMAYLYQESQIHKSRRFEIPLSRQRLAEYLYADRTSLSTELTRLKKEGIISFQKNHFIINECG